MTETPTPYSPYTDVDTHIRNALDNLELDFTSEQLEALTNWAAREVFRPSKPPTPCLSTREQIHAELGDLGIGFSAEQRNALTTYVVRKISEQPTVQDLVRRYTTAWKAKGQWVQPNFTDALDFAATEIAETIDLRLRRTSYVRNNDQDVPSNVEIATELFDCIMMCCVALDILGIDLMRVAEMKLERMDEKRK
jgi:hypothetical protein